MKKAICVVVGLCVIAGLTGAVCAVLPGTIARRKWSRLLEEAKAWRKGNAPDDFTPADIKGWLSAWIVESPAARAACARETLETGTLEERQLSAAALFWASLLAQPSVGEDVFRPTLHGGLEDELSDLVFEGGGPNPVLSALRGVDLDRLADLLWFESEYVWQKADWPPGREEVCRARRFPFDEKRVERPFRYAYYAHGLLEFVTGKRLGRWKMEPAPFPDEPHSRDFITYDSLQEEIDAAVAQIKSALAEMPSKRQSPSSHGGWRRGPPRFSCIRGQRGVA